MKEIISFMFETFLTLKMLLVLFLCILTILTIVVPAMLVLLRLKYCIYKAKANPKKLKVAFFHPYCNALGGGEKVLWVAIQTLQKRYPTAEISVFTGDVEATPSEILQRVASNLNVKVDPKVKIVYLHKRSGLEAARYPILTLLGQALGSICLAFEALGQLNPDIFIDTTGFSFTLLVFKVIAGCKTASYVHYPTITTDMIEKVSSRRSMYNNRSYIAKSPFLTYGKLVYYRMFAAAYSFAGQFCDLTMVNSTFTMEHLTVLWNKPMHLIYPPCDVSHLVKLPKDEAKKANIRILSLSQFRPEKDHPLQLQALYELRELIPDQLFANVTLVMCGGCRNEDDKKLVKDLVDLSKHLSLENNVEFKVNISYQDLLKELEYAQIGIHTMIDEHFGISVVEQLAAGLMTVAHRSGGPLLDIIETSEGSRLGFLAVTPLEYAHTLKTILEMEEVAIMGIRERARASVDRFSTKKFEAEILRAVEPLFQY
ncbi:PREDICTED: GDP-Man:Man(3)GlcNAc(2)-PP-Dol alpha-1,2-mannosyltransferase [Nicrophorus vespilloides]|uniref:GDP-Man:Man(3)GlcNAc(2)-PP-Dol alpha-1,2-mannosyltransferase n=1 Tax=Nicrophorus vespilloides TaxID=110193 RepID=A0ABM1NK17_NICVS|nr:PREDICTED: GDP-Man:Man(3)GlcNAc(2)-PP-Dol alpha-1,2-mannosyltransferase [Nicrophorus vespilloides]